MTSTHHFDAQGQSLDGLHAISASAGTGKTYTITLLWLRLLLEKHIPVDRILVSTFTKAATAELKERLRSALDTAIRALDTEAHADGDAIAQIVWHLRDRGLGDGPVETEHLRQQLRTARSDFDLAPISTIHGFCTALIARHGFELGADPDAQLSEGSTTTLDRLTVDRLVRCAELRAEPQDDCLKTARTIAEEMAITAISLPESYDGDLGKEVQDSYARLRAERELIDTRISDKNSPKKLKEAIDLVLNGNCGNKQDIHTVLTDNQYNSCQTDHPNLIAAYNAAYNANIKAQQHLWRDLLDGVRSDYPQAKRQQGERTFADLLQTVYDALQRPSGAALAQAIRERFQAVMIDESQDSDTVQIDVFRRIFAGNNPGESAMPTQCFLVIGDPKQSIYRFRGADLSSYLGLSALAQPAGDMHINWRSDGPLVTVIDQLYQSNHPTFMDSASGTPIPYVPVTAHYQGVRLKDPHLASSERISSEPDEQRRHELLSLPLLWSSADKRPVAKNDLARQTAEECQRLLTRNVQIVDRKSETSRALRASDIAIIANTRQELGLVRRQLRHCGIPSQFSGRGLGSVLESDEARDLQLWLRALAACDQGDSGMSKHLSGLLSTPLYAANAADCRALHEDPQLQADLVARCQQQAQALKRHGPLPVVLRLLASDERLQRSLSWLDGERLITNWRHVADLLQGAWTTGARSAEACAQALQHLMAEAKSHPDATMERLETDLPAVQLVTTHGSKGLEYPIVFCPFLWHVKAQDKRKREAIVAKERSMDQPRLAIRGAADFDSVLDRDVAQEIEEGQRLLYVALTRARHRCYVGFAAINERGDKAQNGSQRSAVAHLWGLHNVPLEQWEPNLRERFAILNQTLALLDPDEHEAAATPRHEDTVAIADVPVVDCLRYAIPRTASFSGLTRHQGSDHGLTQDRDAEDVGRRSAGSGLFVGQRFGVALGNQVHDVLEQVIGNRRDLDAALPTLPEQHPKLAQREALRRDMQCILHTPLPLLTDRPAPTFLDLRPQAIAEMHFLLPAHGLQPRQLSAALLQDPAIAGDERRRAWAADIAHWSFSTLTGFLQGYIDLTVVYENRWFVIDYKTNGLADYDHEHCERSMLESNYLLQARLYCLALHRHLSRNLIDYCPDTHLGGCAYTYLRGFDPDQPGRGLWLDRVTPQAIAALDAAFSAEPVGATP